MDVPLAIKVEPDQKTTQRSFVVGTKDFLSPEVFSHCVIENGVVKKNFTSLSDLSTKGSIHKLRGQDFVKF